MKDWKPTPVMDECIAGGFFGEDREGHPVWYDNMGNLDPRGLYVCAYVFLEWWVSGVEWLCPWLRARGPRVQASPTLAIFHLVFHLPSTSPTTPPSCDGYLVFAGVQIQGLFS